MTLKRKHEESLEDLQDLLGSYKPCEFKLSSSKVLFVGVIPASKCDPDKPGTDATTKAATTQLGFIPDWYDILKVSPDCAFGNIGFQRIADYIKHTHTPTRTNVYLWKESILLWTPEP